MYFIKVNVEWYLFWLEALVSSTLIFHNLVFNVNLDKLIQFLANVEYSNYPDARNLDYYDYRI